MKATASQSSVHKNVLPESSPTNIGENDQLTIDSNRHAVSNFKTTTMNLLLLPRLGCTREGGQLTHRRGE